MAYCEDKEFRKYTVALKSCQVSQTPKGPRDPCSCLFAIHVNTQSTWACPSKRHRLAHAFNLFRYTYLNIYQPSR